MRWCCLVWVIFSLSAWPENLLTNPSFEILEQDMPAGWKVFVMPMEGAVGRVDTQEARQGRCSVMLLNPREYPREPANNWSQNVLAPLEGKSLVLRGYVKTRDATEAALWAQCCSLHPWRVLHLAATSAQTPRTGTSDWAPVEVRFDVPNGTDYIVVRCVLQGRGAAWFDEITLEEAAPSAGAEARLITEFDDKLTRTLLDTYEAMAETNRILRESNLSLAQQLAELEAQVRALQQKLGAAPGRPASPKVMPPLVPRGYVFENDMLRPRAAEEEVP